MEAVLDTVGVGLGDAPTDRVAEELRLCVLLSEGEPEGVPDGVPLGVPVEVLVTVLLGVPVLLGEAEAEALPL
jgi:hypothetical protein